MNDSMTREEAIKKLTQLKNKFLDEYIDYNGTTSAYDMAIEALSQPERKKGKWIDARDWCGEFLCSNCHETNINNFYKYCPNCGAEMEKA